MVREGRPGAGPGILPSPVLKEVLPLYQLLKELLAFLRARRKWWLLPIVVALLLVGALIAVSASSPLGPFVYPLF